MRQHRVAVLGFDGMAPFELGVAAEVFALPRPELEVDWWYSFAFCAEQPGSLHAVGGFTLLAPHGLRTLARAGTIIVPGTADVRRDPSPEVLSTLRRAHRRGVRIVSICSGAFVLAAAGLLDDRRAATHWRYAELLQTRFPRVQVDSNVLYVDDGNILTSAGTAAGIDACLHLIRTDHGAAIANRVARRMVVAPHRDGGQAQFIEQPLPQLADDPIARIAAHAHAHLADNHTVSILAARAHLSTRQFSRRFKASIGSSPTKWLIQQRIEATLPLLENDSRSIEAIGRAVGFRSPAIYRKHFREMIGVSPAKWRQRFQPNANEHP